MPKGFCLAAALSCLLLLGSATNALGWGKEAHQVIGAIADRRLSPVARLNVSRLLGGETLQAVADWADTKQASEHPRRWHYVDIPPQASGYVPADHCPDDDCLVARIPSFLAVLRDPAQSLSDRANALRFLVNLIGDVHAPANCVLDRDRGGNELTIDFFGQRATPRMIWSSLLVRHRGLSPAAYAALLDPRPSAWDIPLNFTWAQVAIDSHDRFRMTVFRYDLRATAYYSMLLPHVEHQLKLAGIRLAAVLNGVLGEALLPMQVPAPSTPQTVSAEPPVVKPSRPALLQVPASSRPRTSSVEPPVATVRLTAALPNTAQRAKASALLLAVLRTVGGAIVTYMAGIVAILLLAHRRGSGIVARSRLQQAALAPLRIQPALARQVLFIGYARRILRRPDVAKAAEDYFGVPALLDKSETVLPDREGTALHAAIASQVASQRPLFVIGAGGAGKSTLLARLAYLGTKGNLPGSLRGFIPVLVSSAHYSGDLVAAIGVALRDSACVGIGNERVTVIDLLQSGSFLILLDGLSEVFGDQEETFREVLRTARSADLSNCRFVITSRSVHGDIADAHVISLQPLEATTIETILKELKVTDTHRNRVRLQIASFGGRTIEPLLFTMMMEASSEQEAARTRSQLYERYFRKLLKIPLDDSTPNDPWLAWRDVLERIAARFVLPDGRRGTGLTHEQLVDYLCGKRDDGKEEEDLPTRLRRLYRVDSGEAVDLLNKLGAARLLVRERRWRFAHDTFEEYFLASYVLARVAETGTWSAPQSWAGTNSARALVNVARFLDEMADDDARSSLLTAAIPFEWDRMIRPEVKGEDVQQNVYDRAVHEDYRPMIRPAPLRPQPPQPDPPKDESLQEVARLIEDCCRKFSVDGEITAYHPGPVVTTFDFKPSTGVKYAKVVNLADDLALALKTESVRVDRISGSSTAGIEVPNRKPERIALRDIMHADAFAATSATLPLALGRDVYGEPVVVDLATMPHLLVAGATGTGKTLGINSMVVSLLYKALPKQLRLLMIDSKMAELKIYADIPHLLHPIIADPRLAITALIWAVSEMENRYRTLAECGVRNVDQYNVLLKDPQAHRRARMLAPTDDSPLPESLPNIVVVIDELADLITVMPKDVEYAVTRLAQKARAVGIHLIVATQRPSVDVIASVIKANFPARISYRVATKADSRTILDTQGAEKLLGDGDMLFLPPGTARLRRIHGAYVSEQEINEIVEFVKKNHGKPKFIEQITKPAESGADAIVNFEDPKYDEAVRVVLSTGQTSAAYLQRRLKLGYSRAARLIDIMEANGVVGPSQGSKPRDILIRTDDYQPPKRRL